MRRVRFAPHWLAALGTVFLPTIGAALAGPAINQFELKDLESEPGFLQFQSQNAHSWGQPRRRAVDEGGGDFKFDDNSVTQQRHALELEMGLTRWFKMRVGIEFEKERVDDPGSLAAADAFDSLKFTEVAVEGILILVPPKKNPVGLGLLAEFQHPVDGESNTLFFGPLLQSFIGPWTLNANLMLVRYMGGDKEARDEKWDFSYATQVKYTFSENVALALEAYGTIDRLGNSGRRSAESYLFGDHDQHRMGPVVYYSFKPEGLAKAGSHGARSHSPSRVARMDDDDGREGDNGVEVILGFGLLFGLNDNTPDTTFKWSVEVEF